MKTSILRLAIGYAAWASSVASAQYYAPPAARPTAVYRSPAAAAQPVRVAQAATRPTTSYPQGSQSVQPAMVAAPPTFRPINPPTRTAQQRMLTAQRSPTPAPPQVRPASTTTAAQPVAQPMGPAYQPPMNGQPWIPPTPSMPYDSGVSGYGMGAGAPTGAAPMGAVPPGAVPPGAMPGGAMPGGAVPGGAVPGGAGPMAGGPVADPAMDDGYAGGGCGGGGCGTGCGRHCCCCGLLQHGCCIPCRTTGDLVQHMPFFGTTHGYYYFRPYHVMHVFSQQELATRWGGDPRNPYDNTIFQRVYEQMGVEARPEVKKAVPTMIVPTPTSEQEYVTPGPSTMPTPVPTYSTPSPSYVPTPSSAAPGRSITPLPGVEPVPTPIP